MKTAHKEPLALHRVQSVGGCRVGSAALSILSRAQAQYKEASNRMDRIKRVFDLRESIRLRLALNFNRKSQILNRKILSPLGAEARKLIRIEFC